MHKTTSPPPPLRVLSLFDGISVGYDALARAGFEIGTYYSSEIDKHAIAVSLENHPDIVQLGCIRTLLDPERLRQLGEIDIILAAPPCQGFSSAGLRGEFKHHQSALYYDFLRILRAVKPKWFLVENVKHRRLMEQLTRDLGVEPITINSALVSGQNRIRTYWTNIHGVHQPSDKGILLSDITGDYDYIWRYPRGGLYNRTVLDDIVKCPTITSSNWKQNFFICRSREYYYFTAEQIEQLQTLPVGYTKCVSEKQRFRLIGAAWTLDVITHILRSATTSAPSSGPGRMADQPCDTRDTREALDNPPL